MTGLSPRNVAALAVIAVLALPASALRVRAADPGPDGIASGQVESYAMRVEYDLPLPVGTGTVAQVVGEVRSSPAGQNSHGFAAAPTAFDAVVGGKYIDPQGTGHPVRNAPQSECFHPGSLVDTHMYFPTETQSETKPVPPTGYSTARCGAGPEVDLHARVLGSDGAGSPTGAVASVATAGTVASDALARPVRNTLETTTQTNAQAVSILNGAIRIGAVSAFGHSAASGRPGSATSRAEIQLDDIQAGGQTFGLASSSIDGRDQIRLTVAGQSVGVDTTTAKSVLDAANAGLKPAGCSLTPVSSPSQYPQGYLFSRPDPAIGVRADGTLAASWRGGLLVVCDMPRPVTDNFGGFSPERVQILVGFAYTGSTVTTAGAAGGFTLGDLGSVGGSATLGGGFPAGGAPLSSFAIGGEPHAAPDVPSATDVPSPPVRPPAARAAPAASIVPYDMDDGLRWTLFAVGLLVWAALTHVGARRFLAAVSACDGGEGP